MCWYHCHQHAFHSASSGSFRCPHHQESDSFHFGHRKKMNASKKSWEWAILYWHGLSAIVCLQWHPSINYYHPSGHLHICWIFSVERSLHSAQWAIILTYNTTLAHLFVGFDDFLPKTHFEILASIQHRKQGIKKYKKQNLISEARFLLVNR